MVKEIQLTQGKITLVDDEEYEILSQFKWYCRKDGFNFYAVRGGRKTDLIKRKTILMHAVIINVPKGLLIDHIDGDGLNNQKHNLRISDKRGNAHNYHHVSKTSKYPGVCFLTRERHWKAAIWVHGKNQWIGMYATEELAHEAYLNYYNVIVFAKTNCMRECCCD